MKKRLALILTAALIAGTLTACGSSEKTSADASSADGELQVITVAATAVPHAEILEAAKPLLAEKGYDLQVTVFDDYVQPNNVVESGEIDANYFQHIPYLDSFNEEQGTHLVNAGGIHYEPFGIYAGTESDLSNVSDGATIAVPNDTTNEARALLLLQDNGLLTLSADAGINATVLDIAENPHNIEFVEMEAAQVPKVLGEVSFAVINGNYALDAGLNAQTDALATETSDSLAAQTYVNVIAVKEGNESSDATKALVEVLKSDEIRSFIEGEYQGAVVPFE
ncbi:MAG: ABC transporter substrate-binding protein [Lachnospiraceae bacterium]|nr:ABC transporter substrate-binding protein [Lachnospiraceae bacterium]